MKQKITMDQWLKEVDRLKEESNLPSHTRLTEEQKKFLRHCRQPPKPLSYDKISTLWERIGWGKASSGWIRTRCMEFE